MPGAVPGGWINSDPFDDFLFSLDQIEMASLKGSFQSEHGGFIRIPVKGNGVQCESIFGFTDIEPRMGELFQEFL